MAFQQPTLFRPAQQVSVPPQQSTSQIQQPTTRVEESQEWILFAPSQAQSSTHATSQTVGLSRASYLGSLQNGLRNGSSVLDDVTEDDLDSLDDGLHAFREPPVYQTTSSVPVLPTHDGLGTFPPSAVLEQLWHHEQHNPKRKHPGHHRRASSVHRKFENVQELEAQANEEKRMRIEKWRIEQSQAFMEEIEQETRRQMRREKQKQPPLEEETPLWRRITRKFIRDVIGIDEPLLSVILGESLPGDETPRPLSPLERDEDHKSLWRDRLLQRIARELGVFIHQLTPHPGAFSTYQSTPDYAGMPIGSHNHDHAANWGFEDEQPATSPLDLQKEREYWERELDVKLVFQYLKDRFASPSAEQEKTTTDISATRTAIIRQHHPLVGRQLRKDSRLIARRMGSSCASESVKSGRKASRNSSRHYWDIGGSVGSGSLLASGAFMGV